MVDETKLSEALSLLIEEIVPLTDAWAGEKAELTWPLSDVIHHVSHAITPLDRATCDPTRLVPHGAYDLLDGEARVLGHEAHHSALALAGVLRQGRDAKLAPPNLLAGPELAVALLLDELAPFVSRSDVGLRRVVLDNVPLEDVLAEFCG